MTVIESDSPMFANDTINDDSQKRNSAPKVSVIVPVYKAEQYLSKCIDSILVQTISNFELLLIDDGSPDHCGVICDEYAARDSRIRVFHKENGGVSSARNLGLDSARGEWLAFIDSDDWVGREYLEPMSGTKDVDIIHFGYIKETNKKDEITVNPCNVGVVNRDTFFLGGNYSSVSVSYFFKRVLIEKFCIRFNTSVKYSEDREFIMKNVMCSNKIFLIKSAQYHYVFNPNSAVNTRRSLINCKDDIVVMRSVLDFISLRNIDVNECGLRQFFALQLKSYIFVLSSNCENYIDYKSEIIEFKSICNSLCEIDFSVKDKCLFSLFSIFPCLFFYIFRIKRYISHVGMF